MTNDFTKRKQDNEAFPPLKFLAAHQLSMIDEALCSLGEYGEVKLVVEKGKLRFIVTQKSHDVLKWQPGSLG